MSENRTTGGLVEELRALSEEWDSDDSGLPTFAARVAAELEADQ